MKQIKRNKNKKRTSSTFIKKKKNAYLIIITALNFRKTLYNGLIILTKEKCTVLKNHLTERVYLGDLYCFCVTEFVDELDGDGFFMSMCSRQEYDSDPNPAYTFVGIKRKADGWTLEKIEETIDDKEFVFEAAMMCMSQASEFAKITKASQEQRQERLLEEVKAEIRNASEVSSQTCWTLEEASKFSKIGINRLRQESLKKSCPWVLWVGETKRLVKIDAFKEWLADIAEVY